MTVKDVIGPHEPDGTVSETDHACTTVEHDRGQVAKKIAMNLFNYLQSFDDVGSQRGIMTVPTNVFERWIKRFEEKFALDPNFFMNSG